MRTMAMLLAGVFITTGMVTADEVAIPLDKLPKAVGGAVKKRFPKAVLVEAAKETEDDKTEFEVTIKDGDTKIDVMLNPNGAITLIEKQIAAKALPKAVTDALGEKYPKATFTTVEELIKVTDGKGALDAYEVLLVTADKKTFEVKLTAAGKITETEEKTEDDDKQ